MPYIIPNHRRFPLPSVVVAAVSPITIFGAGLIGWYDFQDDATLTGTPVTSIADKSGNGNTITATTGASKNATGINSKQSLTFDGTLAKAYISGSITLGTEDKLSLFVIAKINASISFNARIGSWSTSALADYSNAGCAVLLDTDGSTTFIEGYRNNAQKSVDGTGFTAGTVYRLSSIFDGTNHTYYRNNTAATPVASTGNFNTPGLYSLGAGVDSGAVSNNPFFGEIGEYVIVKGAITSTQRSDFDSYLTGRW